VLFAPLFNYQSFFTYFFFFFFFFLVILYCSYTLMFSLTALLLCCCVSFCSLLDGVCLSGIKDYLRTYLFADEIGDVVADRQSA